MTDNLPVVAVTGSQRPYVFDLPQLLSLPWGFEFRFRYRHAWVDSGLLSTIDATPDALAGREIMILFHSQSTKRLLPLRKGVIIGVEDLGPLILVRFRVEEFVRLNLDLKGYSFVDGPDPESSGGRHPVLEEVAAELSERAASLVGDTTHYDLSEALPNGWYLREALHQSDEQHWSLCEPVAWARVVALLHGDQNLSGIPFFFLLGFRTDAGHTVPPTAIDNRFAIGREVIYGFALKELQRYRMRVLEWCERAVAAPSPRLQLKCEYNADHVHVEGKNDLVVGRYDVVEFTILAQRPGYSEIGLRAEDLAATEKKANADASTTTSRAPSALTAWPTLFAARVPVVVKRRTNRAIFVVFMAVVGIGLYVRLAPSLTSAHPTWSRGVELLALALMLPLGKYVEEFRKLGGTLERLKRSPKAWES